MRREELLDKYQQPIKVLKDGFIRLVDVMGDDSAVVQSARVSYGAGTRSVRDDRGLIRYLLRHRHTTPFESCVIKLHWRIPMDIWRQAVRHRSASLVEGNHGQFDDPSVNEYSTRYSEVINSVHTTAPDEWRLQSTVNKQGSDSQNRVVAWPLEFIPPTPYVSPGGYLSQREEQQQRFAREVYEERLQFGVAREQARKDIPLSTMTEAYWIQDLWNLLHFLKLRDDGHAQQEIVAFARAIDQIVQDWVPLTYEAYRDYMKNAVSLSGGELHLLQSLLPVQELSESQAKQLGLSQREYQEFLLKFPSLTPQF